MVVLQCFSFIRLFSFLLRFCDKLAAAILNKFMQQIYKCRPISSVGCEQLLLDCHGLKAILMELPVIGSKVKLFFIWLFIYFLFDLHRVKIYDKCKSRNIVSNSFHGNTNKHLCFLVLPFGGKRNKPLCLINAACLTNKVVC